MSNSDEMLEEAAIKSWLLFNHNNIKKNRDKFFTISVLSILLTGGKSGKSREELLREYIEHYGSDVDGAKVYNKLDNLLSSGVIQVNEQGEYSIPKESLERVDETDRTEKKEINDIAEKVIIGSEKTTKRSVVNREQLRLNICSCIHYYFRSSCHAMIGMDNDKDINQMPELQNKLAEGMNDKDYDPNVIIGQLGSELADSSHSKLCDTLARKYLASQIVGKDPLLRQFKESVISHKVFVLDTDTVLNTMASNTGHGRVYMNMLDDLRHCGCTIYLPYEVINEVFHHAEAAVARYPFVSNLMNNDGDIVPSLLKNLFVTDYYFLRKEKRGKCPSWDNYIGNIYNKKHGVTFTREVVERHFNGKVRLGVPDNSRDVIDDEILNQLTATVYRELSKTEKAQTRDDALNYEMAKSDAFFFLMVNGLNDSESSRETARRPDLRSPLLRDRYYVISSSHRTYICAKDIKNRKFGNFTCNPKTLIMILSEIGLSQEKEFRLVDVLDNPLISKVAQVIEDDLSHLNEIGVDFRGKNLVSLRYDLHDQLDEMLTYCHTNEFDKVVEIIRKKDVTLRPEIQEIIDQRDDGLKREAELRKQLEEAQAQIREQNSKIEQRQNEIEKDAYIQRALRKIKRKKNN